MCTSKSTTFYPRSRRPALEHTTTFKFRIHYPNSAAERTDLLHDVGSKAVVNIFTEHDHQVDSLRTQFYSKGQARHTAVSNVDCGLNPLAGSICQSPEWGGVGLGTDR